MGEGVADTNPVIGTNKHGAEKARERVLTDEELLEIWNACRDDDYGRIIKLLILTGQRRGEVGGMCRSELQLDLKRWSLPKDRTKNGRPHDVPLSEPALEIIQGIPDLHDRNHLFGRFDNAFAGWDRSKRAMDARIVDARKRRGKRAPAHSHWTIHDLRRTAATRMADLGVQPHVIEAVLNHFSGAKAGVAGIYNRSTYAPEKRAALDKWAEHVEALVAGKPSNVTHMQGTQFPA